MKSLVAALVLIVLVVLPGDPAAAGSSWYGDDLPRTPDLPVDVTDEVPDGD